MEILSQAHAVGIHKPSYFESQVKKEKRDMDMCLRSVVHKHLAVDRYEVVGHFVLEPSSGAKTV